MERYQYSPQERATLERLRHPFAVYQLVGKRIVCLLMSDGFCELFKYDDRDQAYRQLNSDVYQNVHPDDRARTADAFYQFTAHGDRCEIIFRVRIRGGSEFRVIHAFGEHVMTETGARLAHIWYADEGVYGLEGTELNQTLSEALHANSLVKASQYDDLTGLPSMTHFFELALSGKEAILEKGGRPAILYIDFIGMKFFNNKYGFSEGDRLLKAFAWELTRLFGLENCCHIGADHFAVLAEEEGLEDRLERMFAQCREMNGGRMPPVHVGVYLGKREDDHVSVALDRAKLACAALKGHYGMAVNYYSKALSEDAEKRQYIIENIDRAIEERWIQVHYQPIVRAANGRVCEEEALARWNDPVKGFLSPADFIPTLEESGLIYKLDLYVLDQVLEKMRKTSDTGLYVVPHSINLSRSDFAACDIVEEIRRKVDASGIPRDKITVEITESVIGRNFDFMKAQVERFQSLGFPVWMDDFGSGYSSLDVLQSIRFDLIKFDMSFTRKLDESDSARIILTELMKMATSLGVDTVCEGVETQEQVRFLQEIGCSKLQGFYYCKAIPLEQIVERNRKGIQIGYENPEESSYYEAMGRVNLYDLGVIASEDDSAFHNAFNTLPMGILEIGRGKAQYVRSSRSYREFMKRFFGFDVFKEQVDFGDAVIGYGPSFITTVRQCCESGNRAFFDETMPDGTKVHAFLRRIGVNPVNGNVAIAVAILSISDPDEGESFADIARALAADYYNIYVIDLDTERFVEYNSSVGGEELAVERHGTDFFAEARRETMRRIYEADREPFLAGFSKENVVRELDIQGVYTATYRLIDSGAPMYASMKITRTRSNANRIIMGISIVDAQMKEQARYREAQHERETLARMMALSDDYLSLYSVDPATGRYIEYSATSEYETLGFAKEGEDFFLQGVVDGKKTVHPDDLALYLEQFTKENVLEETRKGNVFKMQYRLVIGGQPRPVSLRIAPFKEKGEEKLVAGVRAWRQRAQR